MIERWDFKNVWDMKLPSRYFGCDRNDIKKHRKKIDKLIKKVKIRK